MAGKKSTNGKKRQSPSRERLLALALVRLIECLGEMDNIRERIEAIPEGAKLFAQLGAATDEARKVLADNSFGDLESIATRVARITADLESAIAEKDGVRIAELGAALDRAKEGKPPLKASEKKPKTPAATSERKPRKKKADNPALPNGEGLAVECLYPGCGWKGTGVVDSACPACGSAVVAATSSTLTESLKPSADASVSAN